MNCDSRVSHVTFHLPLNLIDRIPRHWEPLVLAKPQDKIRLKNALGFGSAEVRSSGNELKEHQTPLC